MSSSSMRRILAAAAAAAALAVVISAWQLGALRRSSQSLGELRLSLDSTKSGVEELETKLRLLDEEIAKLGFVKTDIYFTRVTEDEIEVVAVKRVVESGDGYVKNVMEALIEGPGINDEGIYPALPESVKVLSAKIESGIATVDLSGEVTEAGFGSEGELAMVSCIVNTLTSIKGVEKARILVEGKVVESLGGHVFIGEPLGRIEDLLH